MDTREREQIVKKIVDGIIDDMSDRSGLGNVWDEMDDEIQEDVKKEWQAIVRRFVPVTVKK